MTYKNAQLDKRIAELRGNFAPTPIEPSCSGYATSSTDLLMQGLNGSMQALNLTSLAEYERKYAASRKYQTEYLRSASLGLSNRHRAEAKAGTEFVLDQEKAAELGKLFGQCKE